MPKETRIVQICEPLFLYICELNRLRGEGITAESSVMKFSAVRHRIESLLEECEKRSRVSNRLQSQWKEIEHPLYYFIDEMVEEILGARNGEEPFPAAGEWAGQRLADQRLGVATSGTEFFNCLQTDLTRRDNDLEARERLEFYYTCLGLGYAGMYLGQPSALESVQQDVAGRVQHLLSKGPNDQFTPDAYEHVISDRLNIDPKPLWWGVITVTVAVLIFFFGATIWLYSDAASGLDAAVKSIDNYGDKSGY